MTEDLLERLAAGGAALGSPALELRIAGGAPDSLDIPAGWTVARQGPGDLGDRLERTARSAAEDGVGRLVILGSDAPLLPLPLVEAAFAALGRADAAVAPAEDGGYVLIGLATGRVPADSIRRLFAGIPWGSDAVLLATRTAARAAGLDLAELPAHWDVDRPADLARLRREIAVLPQDARPPRTEHLLRTLAETPDTI